MTDHTPWPWGHRGKVVFGPDCETICVAHIREADARLIAFAPDMASRIAELEAENARLREALVDIADGMGETSVAYIGRFAPAVARAALGDSEGEQ